MPTLILTPRYTDDSQSLWKAASRLGWTVERLTHWRIPEHLRAVQEPVLYGEALFGPTLAEQLGLTLLNPAEDWLTRLPVEYRHREIRLCTLGGARTISTPQFVKPPNDKSFPANVYKGDELPAEFDDDMPVLVSDVVQWQQEFRCFVLDRTLHTYSIYSRKGELQREAEFFSSPEEDAGLETFIGRLLADSRVDLPRSTVIDVGIIEGRGWACVEQNAAWGAGIYGCDPQRALEVIRHSAVKRLESLRQAGS